MPKRPGPAAKSGLAALVQGAAMLGAAAARPKKKKHPSKSRSVADSLALREKVRTITAPSAGGFLAIRGAGNIRTPAIRVPFTSSYIDVVTTAAGLATLCTDGGVLGSGQMDLHPITNSNGHQNNQFGIAIANLTQCFARWRFASLKFTFHSVVSTAVGGGFVMAWSPDPASTGTVNYATVASCSPSVAFPAWAPNAELVIPCNAHSDWLFTTANSVNSVAEQRTEYFGNLLLGGTTGLTTSSQFGVITAEGVIEYMEVFDRQDIQLRRVPITDCAEYCQIPAPSASSSSVPQSNLCYSIQNKK